MWDKLHSILIWRGHMFWGRRIVPRHALIYTYVFLVIFPLFLLSQEHSHNHNEDANTIPHHKGHTRVVISYAKMLYSIYLDMCIHHRNSNDLLSFKSFLTGNVIFNFQK